MLCPVDGSRARRRRQVPHTRAAQSGASSSSARASSVAAPRVEQRHTPRRRRPSRHSPLNTSWSCVNMQHTGHKTQVARLFGDRAARSAGRSAAPARSTSRVVAADPFESSEEVHCSPMPSKAANEEESNVGSHCPIARATATEPASRKGRYRTLTSGPHCSIARASSRSNHEG